MPEIAFNRFYRYDELSAILQAYVEAYPNLVSLESIGKSFEGRDIWVVTLTNKETGAAEDKPALWLDGNIHSVEVTASTACLYHIEKMVSAFGADKTITHCLDTRTFYICPRVNPDGAEWALGEMNRKVRSSVRPYPHNDAQVEGMAVMDVDGDGRVLFMRQADSNGPWKSHPEESRLLVRRAPDDFEGDFYRLYREGEVTEYDGAIVTHNIPREGLDLNRNFPANWAPEGKQFGAGPAPFSEPETRALGDFITSHNNIVTAIAGHTFSGILLRSSSNCPDDDIPVNDLRAYKQVGKKGSELTGYPAVSIYHGFRYHPKQDISGGFDWVYEHLGIYFWTVEYWAPHKTAGVDMENKKYSDWLFDHEDEDDLIMFKFFDRECPGTAYVDWYTFNHPQLGELEIGGWDIMNSFHNPPLHLLEQEVAPFPDWFVYQALMSGQLALIDANATRVGDTAFIIRLVVENVGYLSTAGSDKAKENKVTREVVAEIELPDSATLLRGKSRQEVGHLSGRVGMMASPVFMSTGFDPMDGDSNRVKIEWLVEAPPGTRVNVSARQARSGKVSATIVCE
ncbi:MAG: M14 family metallopeptidase [Halioglobus sp.]